MHCSGPVTENKLSDILLSFSSLGFSLQSAFVTETGKATVYKGLWDSVQKH